ncbi:SDR family NAD(P)-dependent oxidoreductase [Myceligenerans pegani]|uniref:SDR family NAD(P)-dependent oxidoreductase n=1 Tax=Myceligenerans pegani TaxID=2776917 RepID=A0ABR9MZ50_9MICO|nr:SDR family NAD(P)-dependent oxidoreductase [Myceligenerans sp. TRM 65318]MBE1876678.1 SDR family NAD(P)-dependent oxidoreductase [Myceligenerans sp. TRM 65318]MBE3018949.1 SDR family NAD(P)-dependent oxidoreductase [Myceligenerans sp. TRM 65318]
MTTTQPKAWFITGASRGFGRLWAEAALDRGDRVAATARDVAALAPLADRFGEAVLPLRLDVTDRAAVSEAVSRAVERFGRLDVVVNNAGYGQFGMVEELTEAEVRAELETNFFGTLWVTQAVLPVLRAQGSGHVVQVTSEGGVRAYPGIGAYHASKWAVEGLSESLAQEVASFGIHVTMLEPGPYATEFAGSRSLRVSDPLPAYDDVRAATAHEWVLGEPEATKEAILAVADAENPPLRIVVGHTLGEIEEIYAGRLSTWREWAAVGLAAFGRREVAADGRR